MAYYDALVAKWPSVQGADVVAKLANLNGQAVPGPSILALLTPSAILNAIVPADLAALTAMQVSFLTLVLQGSAVDASKGTTVRAAIQTIFAGKATTLAQLGALVAPYDNPTLPWWQATVAQGGGGYSQPIGTADLTLAGLT